MPRTLVMRDTCDVCANKGVDVDAQQYRVRIEQIINQQLPDQPLRADQGVFLCKECADELAVMIEFLAEHGHAWGTEPEPLMVPALPPAAPPPAAADKKEVPAKAPAPKAPVEERPAPRPVAGAVLPPLKMIRVTCGTCGSGVAYPSRSTHAKLVHDKKANEIAWVFPSDIPTIECDDCGYPVLNEQGLTVHRRKIHDLAPTPVQGADGKYQASNMKVRCNECIPPAILIHKSLTQHARAVHDKDVHILRWNFWDLPVGTEVYECGHSVAEGGVCLMKYTSLTGIVQHGRMAKHKNERLEEEYARRSLG